MRLSKYLKRNEANRIESNRINGNGKNALWYPTHFSCNCNLLYSKHDQPIDRQYTKMHMPSHLIALILVKLSKFACADRKGRNCVENNTRVCVRMLEWANLCGYRSYSKNSIGIDCHTMLAMLSFTDSHTNALSATQIANRAEQHQKKVQQQKSK